MTDYLKSMFCVQVMPRFGYTVLLVSSSDRIIYDFFSLESLKEGISQEIAKLSHAMLEVFDSFSARLEECLAEEEHYLEDVSFKSEMDEIGCSYAKRGKTLFTCKT